MSQVSSHKVSESKHKRFVKNSFAVYVTLILFTGSIAVYNYHEGLTQSVYACFFAITGYFVSMYFLILKRLYALGTFIVYFSLGIGSCVTSYLEGLMSGNIWFQLCLLYAIPFMIRQGSKYGFRTKMLYALVLSLLFITIVISPIFSDYYPQMTKEDTNLKLFISSISSFIVILIFSYLAVRTGKVYVQKIYQEKERAEKEKEVRTRVLSNLGHELRTQINSINGISQLILDENQDKKNKYAETLEYCNNNMLILVNDMLDMHKIESGGFKLYNKPKLLGEILDKTTIPFTNKATTKNLQLESFIDESLNNITVSVDETRLMQVLHNLISNAIKYTEQGGVVFFAKLIEETENTCQVKFTVKDTGIGISKENHKKIFDSFQQVRNHKKPIYGGTGLGLAISKTIVEKMKSKIKIKSEPNKGSTFYFTIKFDKLESKPIQIKETVIIDKTFLSNNSILVVEDNAISMMFASKLLKDHGATVYQAENGQKALEKIADNENLDIVLLDLEMPVLNGFKAVSEIKKLYPKLTVIAFTANIPNQEMIDRLVDLGFDDIISKPFKKEDMFRILQNYIKPTTSRQYA